MKNPDDQKNPAGGRSDGSSSQERRSPQGNAPSWVDDVLDSPRLGGAGPESAGTGGPDLSGAAASRPNLSRSPSSTGDLRIPEPARPAQAQAAEPDDWISRVTGSPPPARANAPHMGAQTSTQQTSTPGLDAWGESQRPTSQPITARADERPVAPYAPDTTYGGDVAQKRLIAGLLAIVLGSLGVHKFYLGMNTQGIMILGANIGVWILALILGLITFLVGFVFTIPLAILVSSALGLLGLIEGILYLTKSDADFQREYLVNKKPWL